MSPACFVDTNVLVYSFDHADKVKHERATALLQELWESGDGCISTQVLLEFAAVSRKSRNPISLEESASAIRQLSDWRVHMPTPEDIAIALEMSHRYQYTVWDCMIINGARVLECAILYTQDLNNGQVIEGVKIVNPFVT